MKPIEKPDYPHAVNDAWSNSQSSTIADPNAAAGGQSLVPVGSVPRDNSLVLDRICFRFNEHGPALFDDLCVDIAHGQMTALIGPAGCGKTTLIRILCGLYIPGSGQVRDLGGRRPGIRGSGNAAISVVPREPMLFGGSVWANLAMADPRADAENIARVSRMAGLDRLPGGMAEGRHIDIGDHGQRLSAGDRRAVAIARALLKRPEVLVLDDTFAGLDSTCRRRLLQIVNGLKNELTVIVAGRRLPAGLQVDKVYRLGPDGAAALSVISPDHANAPRHVPTTVQAQPDSAGRGIQSGLKQARQPPA